MSATDMQARYRFLLGWLLERGVLAQYPNGTWVLRGIYGVDDSGLRGAGRTPEEALDNAVVAARLLTTKEREQLWQDTHAGIAEQQAVLTPNPSPESSGFSADELQLPFTKWKELSEGRRTYLAPEVRRWLGRWKAWDLACSPMNDDERRRIRYGHYMGWFERQDAAGSPGV